MELNAILEGILPSLVMMVAILALTTALGAAAGAALGALAFGVGAVPGAAAGAGVGLEVGTALLEWLGLAFLVVYIGKSLLKGTKMAASAVALAWHSADQPQALRDASRITAARELANAVAEVFRGVLQGLVVFLLAKGVAAAAGRVPELVANLRKSRLGEGFAAWVELHWETLVSNPRTNDALRTQATQGNRPRQEALSPSQADSHGNGSSTTVLGHYPEYKQLGDRLGANTFQISEAEWNSMSETGRWEANQAYLDQMIASGDDVVLATPLDQVRPGSYFARELEYMASKGYAPSGDGTRLIKGP